MDRDTIIDAALQIATESGWEKASIRNIARRIDYSTMKVYSEFSGKVELLAIIQERGFAKLREVMLDALEDTGPAEAQFLRLNLAYYAFTKTHRAYYSLMFQMDGTTCGKASGATLRHTSEPIRKLIGKISGAPCTKSQFFNWWAMMHGYVSITQGTEYGNAQELRAMLTDMVGRFTLALKATD